MRELKRLKKMKYRRLTNEELDTLEKEFVEFLVSNTITADDWIKLKNDNIDEANLLIDLFSDIVMEKVLQNIKYLEYREAKSVMLFECGKDRINLIGLTITENIEVDLTNNSSIQELLEKNKINDDTISVFKTIKNYSKVREVELFEMTQNNCLVSDGALFYTLNKMV